LIEKDCETFCKLYEDVYAHPPPNGDYLAIFLHNPLPQNKDIRVNWVQYARDTTHQQKIVHKKSSFFLWFFHSS
jgi:hypothetical protein